MAAEKPPAFQFYPKDFLSSDAVSLMTTEQVGAYTLLLCHSWLRPEGLPADLASLSKLARVPVSRFAAKVWPGLKGSFIQNDDGLLCNARMERGRREQDAYRAERSQSGKRGAAAKWGIAQPSSKNGSAINQPLAKNSSSSATASSTASAKDQNPPTPLRGAVCADGRASWFWAEWRSALERTRGISASLHPRERDVPVLVEICEMVPEDSRLREALDRFMRLTPEQSKALSVKVISPATFRMALPKLLEAEPVMGTTARTAGNVAALEAFVAKGQAS